MVKDHLLWKQNVNKQINSNRERKNSYRKDVITELFVFETLAASGCL